MHTKYLHFKSYSSWPLSISTSEQVQMAQNLRGMTQLRWSMFLRWLTKIKSKSTSFFRLWDCINGINFTINTLFREQDHQPYWLDWQMMQEALDCLHSPLIFFSLFPVNRPDPVIILEQGNIYWSKYWKSCHQHCNNIFSSMWNPTEIKLI